VDHLLEFGQRQACSGLLPYVLQELKAALIGYAIRHADIEERPYGGLARSTLANAPGQLFGAVGYEGAINAVNTRMPSGTRFRGFQPGECLDRRRAVNAVEHGLEPLVAHIAVDINDVSIQFDVHLRLPEHVVRWDLLTMLPHDFHG
jgi:hypothetical protein